MAWLRSVIRTLQKLGSRQPSHLTLGQHGEIEAYFYLKQLGYQFVATNFRVPHNRGEIDLIGWDHGTLCFVEVKTRSDASFAPPSTAVTANKRRNIISVARRYLRRMPGERRPSCRFDILSIVASDTAAQAQFTLQKGAFSWDAGSPQRRQYRDFGDRHYWRKR
ncbi:MAG: YraN family protein [Candidatus Korobacteraceae bacterium]